MRGVWARGREERSSRQSVVGRRLVRRVSEVWGPRTGTDGDRCATSTPPTWYHCIMWHHMEVFEPVCSSRPLVTKELKRTTVSKESIFAPMPRLRMDGPFPTSNTRPSPWVARSTGKISASGLVPCEPPVGVPSGVRRPSRRKVKVRHARIANHTTPTCRHRRGARRRLHRRA
eukprot:scaffold243425_cov41-Tisochrysis_lutea.AAC.3